MIAALTALGERAPWPDWLTRRGITAMVERTSRKLDAAPDDAEAEFAAGMDCYAIAEHPDDANAQHYELPAAFFALILGPRRKYSCCLYGPDAETLAAAEERALAETAAHADLKDGQRILELGCGWGSLSLWMAERFPAARITAVSNSHGQREAIEAEAATRRLTNLRVVTADVNDYVPDPRQDRVVSVEMFEHVSNWPALLRRVRDSLAPDGKLFLHVFSHRTAPYRFDHGDRADWIARHFFTGGIMPSHGLIRRFPALFAIEQEWRWSGTHYERTALDWLRHYDANTIAVMDILRRVYGPEARIWHRRWRLFFLATAGLFGHDGGAGWGISHYQLTPAS